MKHLVRLLPVILVAAVATPALAQPGASEPPPAGGTQADLSHINGTPIKVGEHNEYYYTFRRSNVSANPIGWMMGIYGVSGSYAISNHVAIKGDFTYYNIVNDDDEGVELNATLPIYFRRAYQGAYLEPGMMYRNIQDGSSDDPFDDRDASFGPQVLFGWHWTWDSGLNVAAAAGIGRDMNDEDGQVFGNGYFRVGYAF